MLIECEVRRVVIRMQRELDASLATVYLCAAGLLILFLVSGLASGPDAPDDVGSGKPFKLIAVQHHT